MQIWLASQGILSGYSTLKCKSMCAYFKRMCAPFSSDQLCTKWLEVPLDRMEENVLCVLMRWHSVVPQRNPTTILTDGLWESEIQIRIMKRLKDHNFLLRQLTSTFCLLVHDFFWWYKSNNNLVGCQFSSSLRTHLGISTYPCWPVPPDGHLVLLTIKVIISIFKS